MNKDTFTTVNNPNNLLMKWELWMKGTRKQFREDSGDVIERPIAQCIKAYTSEERANQAKKYYESIQEFKAEPFKGEAA